MARENVKVKERKGQIRNYLAKHEGEYVTRVQIAKAIGASCGLDTIANDITAIKTELTGATIEAKHGVGYMFVRLVDPVPKKNPEGYNDPTAYAAIKAVSPKTFKCGDVHECTASNGFTDMFVIIKTFDDTSLVVKLVEPKYVHGDTEYVHGIAYNGTVYAADIRRLTTKPNKYIAEKIFSIQETVYNDIMGTINEMFGFDTEVDTTNDTEVVDAEIADLKAELAEKDRLLAEMKEEALEIDKTALEWKLMEQKIEIYERLLFGADSLLTISK